MSQKPNIKGRLARLLWHKSDTPEMLDQKVYLVKNGMIASILITISFTLVLVYSGFKLLLLISPILLTILITDSLLIIIKRGIKWFLYFYYCGYIIVCTMVVLKLGGLQYSSGVWGGAFIVFMHTLALKDKRIIIMNAVVYLLCLTILVICFPFLTPNEHLTPTTNNLFFTVNEVWMCLFIVKSFYDSIILRTEESKRRAVHLQELDQLKPRVMKPKKKRAASFSIQTKSFSL
jgi:hypothetical protein